MNNEERIKARIERDKLRRQQKKQEKYKQFDNFENVINYTNYYSALKKCIKGVGWKGSVQRYVQNSVIEIDKTIQSLYQGQLPKFTSTKSIVIRERGKARKIVPVTISDRMTQRVLCDFAMTPVIYDSLIYDNGASMPNKGVEFARKRIEHHLHQAINEYGNDFYALVFDFKSYFESIPHKQCLKILKKHFIDKRIVGLIMAIIRSYAVPSIKKIEDEETRTQMLKELRQHKFNGICLGSQISQVMALAVPNELDHYIKDKCGFKHYIRYMDDGVVIAKSKDELVKLYAALKDIATSIGLKFNENKSHIVSIHKGFTFLKVRYFIGRKNKLAKVLVRSGVTRMRRKLFKFRKKVDSGKMSLDDVYNSLQSWVSHSKIASSYHTRRRMLYLYNKLFDGYRINDLKKKQTRRRSGEILQDNRWELFYWDRVIA